MILLSEAAEKVRNELHSWSAGGAGLPEILLGDISCEVRDGDERLLTEVLSIVVSGLDNSAGSSQLRISADPGRIFIDVTNRSSTEGMPSGTRDSINRKTGAWSPVISRIEDGFRMIFSIPEASPETPVDVRMMAAVTGLDVNDALMVVGGFLNTGRVHLRNLSPEAGIDASERYRAAHSLKGAGKTLHAPMLAAAAREVEIQLKDDGDAEVDLADLEKAWNRIEKWYEESVDER